MNPDATRQPTFTDGRDLKGVFLDMNRLIVRSHRRLITYEVSIWISIS
jgi:hypothetical protein